MKRVVDAEARRRRGPQRERFPRTPARTLTHTMSAFALTASKTFCATPVVAQITRARSARRAGAVSVRAMAKEIIATDKSPAALGPYNQAVKVGNTVYVSGQIGLTPAMEFAGETIEEQTEQVMKNLGEVLAAAGATYADVVKTTIMIADMDDFKTVNGIYGSRFPENAPARASSPISIEPFIG